MIDGYSREIIKNIKCVIISNSWRSPIVAFRQVKINPFSVLSKLFILFLVNFVVITTFFTTYNYNKKVVVTTYNLQLQLQLTTLEEYPPGIFFILI